MTEPANHERASADWNGKVTSLTSGIVWNAFALGFMALAGIGLNLAIGRAYGAAALGTFNITFALYIFFSQIAVFGLHLSVLRSVSAAVSEGAIRTSKVVYSGLILCVGLAVLVTLVAVVSTPIVVGLFPAVPDLQVSWLIATPGLLAFAINKYLLGVVNGLQHMRAFAAFQSLRYVLILGVLLCLYGYGAPAQWLAAALSGSEFVLTLFVLGYVVKVVPLVRNKFLDKAEIHRHLRFGAKVFPAGLVAELNTRVDVLMVGAFLNDRAAGIYSIAGLIYEAALQAVMVLRNNINPRLARAIAEGRNDEILAFSRKLALILTPLLAVGAVTVWLGFPLVAPWIFAGSDFDQVQDPLLWLMLAVPIAGASLCYSLVLSVAGFPFWQSVQMVVGLVVAVVLCYVLIPQMGLSGAAIAMGVSSVVTGLLGIWLARKLRGIRIFF